MRSVKNGVKGKVKMANCRYCGKEITWLKDGRKNIPVEGDGGEHKCEEFMKTRDSLKKINPTEMDPDILKQYQENLKKARNKKK